ncbi:MAG: phosphoribosylpyrophosphate synthetase [Deltaproteobacteria bacterium RBG_13_65_10]|jgi:ribose-phosphate pyrophosphokinase|nr:MAG: phosphoribosylpyrophosphate synthetase [Deltaproteobacteria bacterium RBG_13_65_10]
MNSPFKIFAGNSNLPLAQEICKTLGVPLGKAEVRPFSDGEIMVDIEENVRGCDVFVVQSTSAPSNTNLMELLIMSDAFRRASAKRITAVIPYYGYARQDRKLAPRTPITARLVADLISTAGANRMLCMDLHAGQIQGFFNIPVDNLFAAPIVLRYIQQNFQDDLIVVSPDAGGVERARAHAKRLNVGLAIIDKRRESRNVAEVMNIIGDVKGKTAIIVDDIVDTAGTLTKGAAALHEAGAKQVYGVCTHPVLSGPAIKRVEESRLQELVVTNTIPLRGEGASCSHIKVVSIAPLLSEAIKRIHSETSVSSLFV